MKTVALFASLISVALLTAAPVAAQEWQPSTAVKIVVPYPPGGGTDVVARLMSVTVGDAFGQPIVIENRAGANGVIGANVVYGTKADGQTLLFGVSDIISTTPHVNAKAVTFNADRFSAVAPVATGGYVLVARKTSPNADLAALVASAKAKDSRFTYAHWGPGSMSQMAMEMFKLKAGLTILPVPYPGSAAVLQAVLSGQVDYAFVPPGLAQANTDALRMYAVSSEARIPLVKDVATLAEKGYNIKAETWYGVVAPPGTPKNVVDTLNAGINKAIKTPAFAAKLVDLGYTPMVSTADQFGQYIRAENRQWGDVVRDAQLKVEQ
jgi:tripartite-type tricarboxylate transporter receptor subunit TctC